MKVLTNYISIERELSDSLYLIEQIKQDGWITPDTILINCVPEYSSRLVQLLNHKLSHLNNDSLFEVVNLLLPPSNGNQVWDAPSGSFRTFDNYLRDWVNTYIEKGYKYLFVSFLTGEGRNMSIIRSMIKGKLPDTHFRFASTYRLHDSLLVPDFYHRTVAEKPVYFWENTNIK